MIDVRFGVGMALGVNFAWEWQDGLLNDGFNILDFFAGVIGTLIVFVVSTIFLGN